MTARSSTRRNEAKARPVLGVLPAWDDLDEIERVTEAAVLFCKGLSATQIRNELERRFDTTLTREDPYKLLAYAASQSWFYLLPPQEVELGKRLTTLYNLDRATIVQTKHLESVTFRGAQMLLSMVKDEARQLEAMGQDDEVHVGLAGGHTVRLVIEGFAKLLRREHPAHLPRSLVFHTVNTSVAYHDPTADPNAFFPFLLKAGDLPLETKSVPFWGPSVATDNIQRELEDTSPIRKAREQADSIQIVVTSGASWTEHPEDDDYLDGTSAGEFKALLRDHDPEINFQRMTDAGCVADMLWQPLGPDGPIPLESGIRAMTLFTLDDLQRRIRGTHRASGIGDKVLLVLGPYGDGRHDKGEVLRAALRSARREEERTWPVRENEDRLFTHLVADHRTAAAAVPPLLSVG